MAYKVAIDAAGGGSYGKNANGIVEKDYNLSISKYISNRLNDMGIENFLVRDSDRNLTDEERVNIIKNKYGNGNNIIVISNRLNSGGNNGAEVMYALRNNSKLASIISNNLEDVGQPVLKYYQLRNSNNTALDDDYLIRNTSNNQTIVINYGYIDNASGAKFLRENYEKLGEAVVKAISNYAKVTYTPLDMEGYYIVKKGDSLWSIASKNNTEGSKEDTPKGNTYIVKKGDSLWLIANRYNTTVEKLKKANGLTSNNLSIGQVLTIPEEESSPVNQITYTVKKGDSLWLIANKYDTTVDKIKSTNNLTSNSLSIGQVLIIPSTSEFITYTVKKGDSLWVIANNYNTTVDNIKKLNSLTSNNLTIGQKLLLPA